MTATARVLLVLSILQLSTLVFCAGDQRLDYNKNFLKLAFGVNLDLDSLKEQTIHTISSAPMSDLMPVTAKTDSCAGLYGLHCLDCNTIKVCNQVATPLSNVTCPSNLPYCDSGVCVATSSSSACTVPASTFTCTAIGYFPDPVDCKRFYYCSAESSTTWKLRTYQCPTGFAFNSAKNNCQKTIAACQTFTCTKTNQMVTYKQNAAYYAYCTGTTVTTSTPVFKCPDTTNTVYNVQTYGCEYQCKAEGYFVDTLDETKYYFCYRDGLVYKNIHEACPEGNLFKDGQCVVKSKIELAIENLVAAAGAVTGPTIPVAKPE